MRRSERLNSSPVQPSEEWTNLSFALTALLARLRGALVFDGGGRSQEDASALRARESAILVVVIIVTPRDIVWDQVPTIVRLVLGGLGKGGADRGRDSANGREGGTTRTVELGGLAEGRGEVRGEGDGVRGELCTVVLDFEREGGERHREGHLLRRRERREDEEVRVEVNEGTNIWRSSDRGERLARKSERVSVESIWQGSPACVCE